MRRAESSVCQPGNVRAAELRDVFFPGVPFPDVQGGDEECGFSDEHDACHEAIAWCRVRVGRVDHGAKDQSDEHAEREHRVGDGVADDVRFPGFELGQGQVAAELEDDQSVAKERSDIHMVYIIIA
jgi:hypothetical protein